MNILILEDVSMIRRTIQLDILKVCPHARVFSTKCLEEAFDIISNNNITHLFLDLDIYNKESDIMHQNGIEVLEYYKYMQRKLPETIIISGNIDSSKVLEAHSYGVKRMLKKPHSLKDIELFLKM